MFNFIFGNKSQINEKILEQNKIKIILKQDIKLEKNCIAVTGSGKFYKGLYKNEAVVDISKEESILNEFIYWQEFKNNDCFLHFIGAMIQGHEAHLVFEFFAFTLESALQSKLIKEDNKIKVAKQAIKIIEILQKHKKLTRDFRPGILGITDKMKIKLLDFGFLISDKLINQDIIDKQRLKYVPPEAFLFLLEDISHDIWSFGCLLIDLFSKDHQIFKQNFTYDELSKLHNLNLYPDIPNDINGVLRDIITKCLDKNYQERITITELSENLNILLDTLARSESDSQYSKFGGSSNKTEIESFQSTNPKLKETHEFISKLDTTLVKMNILISDDLMDGTIYLKNSVEGGQELCIKRLSENYTSIKEVMSDISMFKIEILDKLKEKVMLNILQMQQYYGVAMADINDAQNIINEMRININSLSKMSHAEKYTSVLDLLTENRIILEDHVQNYSYKQDYDKILKMYDENLEIVEMFKVFVNNRELLMQDIYEVVRKHQDAFVKNSNIKQLSQKLNIDAPYLKDDVSRVKNISDIYVKMQENSDIVIIYDIEKKKFHQIKNKERRFNSKAYSYYDRMSKSVYMSGGCLNSVQNGKIKKYEKTFLKMEVKINYDEFELEFKDLCDMNEERACHSMIEYNNEFLIVVGGVDTKKCEIYDIIKNTWKYLPDLPSICSNPALSIINNFLFAFSGSGNLNSFDSIHMLSLNNLSRILSGDKGFENVLSWEKIDYYFDYYSKGRLKRGMGALTVKNSILLFGGFDFDNIYGDVFDFNLNKDKDKEKDKNKKNENSENNIQNNNEINNVPLVVNNENKDDEYEEIEEDYNAVKILDTDFDLPIKTYFNSNILLFEDYIIMIDGYNNAIELNLKTREFFYYT